MKLIEWNDFNAPDVVSVDCEGNLQIEDSRIDWNLEIGDQVQHQSEDWGTSCYFVVGVEPNANYFYPSRWSKTKLVTLKVMHG